MDNKLRVVKYGEYYSMQKKLWWFPIWTLVRRRGNIFQQRIGVDYYIPKYSSFDEAIKDMDWIAFTENRDYYAPQVDKHIQYPKEPIVQQIEEK